MKRWGWIVLLVSLGLNLGFGIRLVGARREAAAPGSVPPWHDARFGDAERGRSGSDDTTGRAERQAHIVVVLFIRYSHYDITPTAYFGTPHRS